MQNVITTFIIDTEIHKSRPVTNEIQSPGLFVSYFILTIVLIIPNSRIRMVKIAIVKMV